jgi:hypothetical protein
MSSVQFDHFLTFANVNNIDEYIDQYRALGFLVSEETQRYKPGLRNRFITLGCEYVELVWVENETEFTEGGSEQFARMFANLPALRQAARPFSIGMKSDSVENLHQAWTARGYTLPSVWSFAPPGMPPVFSFQTIPGDLLPGTGCFAITYHGQTDPQTRRVQVAPNTIYAVEGVTFVCATPKANASQWQRLLSPDTTIQEHEGSYAVAIGTHTAQWLQPQLFQARYGLEWIPSPHASGDLAALHLLTETLEDAAAMLGQNAHQLEDTYSHEAILVVAPDSRDGLAFIIRQYPIEQWRAQRINTTGENIVLG